MKKLFLVLAAAFAMVACQTDINEVGVVADGVAAVEFEVGAPQMRSYSDGSSATVLQYAVYDANGDILPELKGSQEIHGSTTVSLELAKNKTYSVIFWAAAPISPYTFVPAEKKVTVNYNNAACNDESRDAFYAYLPFEVTGAATLSVELRRPFAQLNVGATDLAAALKSGFKPVQSALKVKNVFSTLNLVDGSATDNVEEVTFGTANIPSNETFPVAGDANTTYTYMAMSYVLVGKDKASYDVVYTIKAEDNTVITNTIGAVPMQANYRTNIYGKLLTSTTDINVEIKPGYSDDNKYEIIDGKVNITVDNAAELEGALADTNVDVVILGEDIVLGDVISRVENNKTFTVAADKELTIKLNGHTLSANLTPAEAGATLFEVLGTLNIENGTVVMTREDAAFSPTYCTCVFHTSYNGTVNLNGVTVANNGGAGMAYVCDMSNATNATYNVENSTLESSYIAIRLFNNNKNGVHNVIVKNSTLKGKYCVWTQYYLADGHSQEVLDRQLNLDIFNNENTYETTSGKLPILFGYNSYVSANGNGITKVVSEDGSVVTLGSLVENGVVRRYDVGDENSTIKKVIVGNGIAVLENRVFRKFHALEEVILPNGLTTIGVASEGNNDTTGTANFQGCENLKSIVIPETVTTIDKGTFYGCSALESINIPAGVTRIEESSLRATGLKEVEFHAGVTYFGAMAFRDCKQLTKVIINAPEFTMEGNTFGIMAAPFTPMTIEVANDEMKAFVESKLTANDKTYITVVAPEVIDNTADLQTALAEGKNVALANNLTVETTEMLTAPYGNKMAFSQKGGILNGKGNAISVKANGDNYVVMTNGGTIKNLDINRGFRGIVLMDPNQDVHVDNVNIGVNDEVCYTINTAEGEGTHNLYVSNSVLNGWCSIGTAVKAVTFTNCTFGQGTYYTDVYGRLVKPYVDAVFDGCDFCSKCYLDLSAFVGTKVVVKNCTVNGVKLTAENWTSLVAPESTCKDGQISVELKNGTYLTAENVADYIVIE